MSNINITTKNTGKISVSVNPTTPVTISPKAQTQVSIKGVVGATHDLTGTDFGLLYKSGDNKISTSAVTYNANSQLVTFPGGISPLSIYDQNDSRGTAGQILSSTGTALDWISLTEIAGVNGTGTANYVAKWTDGDSITDSSIYDNGTNVGIGTSNPNEKLVVHGNLWLQDVDPIIYGYNKSTSIDLYNGSAGIDLNTPSSNKPINLNGRLVVSSNSHFNGYINLSGSNRYIDGGSGNRLTVYSGSADMSFKIGHPTVGNFYWYDKDDNTMMTLTRGGNLGIGTTNPSWKLHVNTTTRAGIFGHGTPWTSDGVIYVGAYYQTHTPLLVEHHSASANSNSYFFAKFRNGDDEDVIKFRTNGSADFNGSLNINSTNNLGRITVNPTNDSGDALGIDERGFIAFADGGTINTRLRGIPGNTFQFQDASYATFFNVAKGGNSYLNSTGNFGIGTTSPTAKLEVINPVVNGPQARFRYSTDYYLDVGYNRVLSYLAGTQDFRVGTGDGFPMSLVTNNIQRLTITTAGNVGIGTTAPAHVLHINKDNPYIQIQDSSAPTRGDMTAGIIMKDSTGAQSFQITQSNSADVSIRANAGDLSLGTFTGTVMRLDGSNVGIGTTSPSHKLHVKNGSNDLLLTRDTGTAVRIGIGDSNPSHSIDLGSYTEGSIGGVKYLHFQDSQRIDGVNARLVYKGSRGHYFYPTTDNPSGDSYGVAIRHLRDSSTGSNDNILLVEQSDGTDVFAVKGNGETQVLGDLSVTGSTTFESDLTVNGDFTVNGTTTTINSTTLTVDDKNIVLAQGAADAAAANGAGITIDGADATLTYDSTNDEFDFNKDINVSSKVRIGGHNSPSLVLKPTQSNGASQILFENATTTAVLGRIYYDITSNSMRLHTSNAEKLRITSDGKVGIGTTNPGAKLNVFGDNSQSATGVIHISTSGTELRLGGNATYSWIQSHSSKPLYINELGNNLILNLFSGNVGIGTAAPSEKLDVSGNIALSTGGYIYGDSTTPNIRLSTAGGAFLTYGSSSLQNGGSLQFVTSGVVQFRINSGGGGYVSGGNFGIGTTAPSEKLHVVGDVRIQGNFISLGDTNSTITKNSSLDSFISSKTFVVDKGVTNQRAKLEDTGLYISRTSNGEYTSYIEGANNNLHIKARSDIKLIGNLSTILTVQESTQRVGIGTTSPSELLHLSSTTPLVRFDDTNSGLHYIVGQDGNQFKFTTNNPVQFSKYVFDARLQLTGYGSGTHTGTAAYTLRVDSSGNVIETPIGAGAIDGSGTENYLAKWSDADTITNSIIYDDSTSVGIGTTSPSAKLHISDSDPRIRLTDTDGTDYYGDVYQQNGALKIESRNGTGFGNINFQGNNGTTQKEYARFNSTGFLGIGTNSPGALLDLQSSAGGQSTFLKIKSTNSSAEPMLQFDNNINTLGKIGGANGGGLMFKTLNNVEVMRITSDAKVGIGWTAPPAKLSVAGGSSSGNSDTFYISSAAYNGNLLNAAHSPHVITLLAGKAETGGNNLATSLKLVNAGTETAGGTFADIRSRSYGEIDKDITNLVNFKAEYRSWAPPTGPNTLANHYGFLVNPLYVGANGTVTNNYGIHLNPGTTATNNFGVYQSGSGVDNYFQGNVAIGTGSTPVDQLSVRGASAGSITIGGSAATTGDEFGALKFYQHVAGQGVGAKITATKGNNWVSGNLLFHTGENNVTSPNMIITSTGRVGIGTTSPSGHLHVIDSGNLSSGGVFIENTGTTSATLRLENTEGISRLFTNNGITTLRNTRSGFSNYSIDVGGLGVKIKEGNGGQNSHASAILDLDSTTQGVLFPRMTGAQRTAISSPATGLIVYQTDGDEGLYIYKSTGWIQII